MARSGKLGEQTTAGAIPCASAGPGPWLRAPAQSSAALGSVEDAGEWAPAHLGTRVHLAPSRSI